MLKCFYLYYFDIYLIILFFFNFNVSKNCQVISQLHAPHIIEVFKGIAVYSEAIRNWLGVNSSDLLGITDTWVKGLEFKILISTHILSTYSWGNPVFIILWVWVTKERLNLKLLYFIEHNSIFCNFIIHFVISFSAPRKFAPLSKNISFVSKIYLKGY